MSNAGAGCGINIVPAIYTNLMSKGFGSDKKITTLRSRIISVTMQGRHCFSAVGELNLYPGIIFGYGEILII
ncbi:hypothetical protein [Mesobacillus foraminis]|uniref:hypothetical protein n=1 Tax=Mesobacillus foraminis TaxID=279826 RepID=UPI0013CF12A4|nr:hypothetical protein [Mesobacillus foraminis]